MSNTKYPVERNLDGIYFYVVHEGKGITKCFTDLTEEEQNNILEGYEKEQLIRMCQALAGALRQVGDQLDIACGEEE
jgi:uncharacterized membrane protein